MGYLWSDMSTEADQERERKKKRKTKPLFEPKVARPPQARAPAVDPYLWNPKKNPPR